MYEPRKPSIRRPLKKRSAKFVSTPLPTNLFWQTNGWMALITLGTTIVPPRVVPRIFTYIKKLLRYPKTRSRFWVNAQCSFLVTRKPLNVRMGKGKGAKVRFYSKIEGKTPLAALTWARDGLQKRLKRFVGIRLGRRVVLTNPLSTCTKVQWVQRHRTQTSFLKDRAAEIKTLLTFVRKPSLKIFFGRLFRAAWRKPRLRWRFRWPLLPKISSRLKARRRKWGSGLRVAAPIWAGLASLLGGVRKLKAKVNVTKERRLKVFNSKMVTLFFNERRNFHKKNAKQKKIRFLQQFLRVKHKAFFKLIKFRALKGLRERHPYSQFEVPFNSTLTPLRLVWSPFFFSLSSKESLTLASIKSPSLNLLVRVVSILEKSSLVFYGTTSIPPKGQRAYLGGSLALLQKNTKDTETKKEFLSTDSTTMVLSYIVEDGFIDLWPKLDLVPLVLTQVSFNPLLPFFK